MTQSLSVQAGELVLKGTLTYPRNAQGIVVFGLENNQAFLDFQNQFIARSLNHDGLATLLLDLLTSAEESVNRSPRHLQLDSFSLAYRLIRATDWVQQFFTTPVLNIGYFESGDRATAAMIAASERPHLVKAVVSRGRHPDLGGMALSTVTAPTLLIAGGNDQESIQFNQNAFNALSAIKQLEIIPGTAHQFRGRNALKQLTQLTCQWFQRYLNPNHEAVF
ncbi:alpha/beta hydrolase [Lyngbya confervoides]|uniref:Alpha/beta hydrolase n=1 Tax=Lyngbya confervoides BDU141951 TaxID=1574623 RepID=A0ABD4T484_9CYAN|nr:alpha/beta hydrolase [Lyngbya confervoides]MCM1983508.1 alpha/beta hydrolase [Lyngbya confervoides BDU141951]